MNCDRVTLWKSLAERTYDSIIYIRKHVINVTQVLRNIHKL
jgi:hypothetical protein